ncbi:hypothetical protein C8A05DRAFT_35755 [Staphylotrichum tortipilum]|uniref:Uncharacterized protein n=1 Tax=Staphylotrichum tortipilum TaxID=2831512 RepID=A0AAN6MGU1_9PEZI|nr:hypothetical protein C8A05DRAFT_35755 [Staphylotrichum longicolle]
MASEEAFPVHRWPYKPTWELDGFDFSMIPVANYRPAVGTLHRLQCSPGMPRRKDRQPHQHGEVVANNVAVLFHTMMFCKDWWHIQQGTFWKMVARYSLVEGSNMASDLFVRARKAYVTNVGGCPNGATDAVDAWISFHDTPHQGTLTIIPPPSRIHQQEWQEMKRRGELSNCGRALGQQRPSDQSAASRASTPAPAGNRIVFGTPPPRSPPVKGEASPDEVTIVAVNPVTPSERGSKRKRDHTESPGTPGSSSPKRRSNTSARVSKCEDKLAEHLNLIHATDFKITSQEELVAAHVAKLDELETRNTYIRTEIKKVWNDTRNIPSEQEQARFDTIRADLAVHKVRIEDCQKSMDEQMKLLKQKSKTEKLRHGKLTALVLNLEEKLGNNNNNSGASNPDNAPASAPNLEAVPPPPDNAATTITALLERITALEATLKTQIKRHDKLRASHAATLRRLDALEEDVAARGKLVEAAARDIVEHELWLGRHDCEVEQLHAHARAVVAVQEAAPVMAAVAASAPAPIQAQAQAILDAQIGYAPFQQNQGGQGGGYYYPPQR